MNNSRHIITSAIMLGLFAMVGTGLVSTVHLLTAAPIAANLEAMKLQRLNEVLPPDRYDNEILKDNIIVQDPVLPEQFTVRVYRAFKAGQPVAALFETVSPNGYAGPIYLMIGIYTDGSISGVRVLQHHETPGLGDKIELKRSDWVLGFNGKSLGNPSEEKWGVKRDGGYFDQFTGATITPRIIIKTIKHTLDYFQQHRDTLFSHPMVQPEAKEAATDA